MDYRKTWKMRAFRLELVLWRNKFICSETLTYAL